MWLKMYVALFGGFMAAFFVLSMSGNLDSTSKHEFSAQQQQQMQAAITAALQSVQETRKPPLTPGSPRTPDKGEATLASLHAATSSWRTSTPPNSANLLPENFLVNTYRRLNKDLRALNDREATAHFLEHGKQEGRQYIEEDMEASQFEPGRVSVFNTTGLPDESAVSSMPALTPEQVSTFVSQGYLIVTPGFPDEWVENAIAETQKSAKAHGRIQDAWKTNPHIHALSVYPSLMHWLYQLNGRKPLPFQTLNFVQPTQQGSHSDAIHFSSLPEQFMSGVWVALEDVDMANGPVYYYPETQKLRMSTYQDAWAAGYMAEDCIGQGTANGCFTRFAKYLEEQVLVNLTKSYATMKKGQALIWAANIVHGGSPVLNTSRSRLSMVTHVYYEGCKYWTPMVSNRDTVHFRHPNWIPQYPARFD
jgi:hypothetical protein